MPNYNYENHVMPDPLLPFIFHRDMYRSPTATDFSFNWHENIELLYCTEGAGQVQCIPDTTDLRVGELFLINANTPHRIASDSRIRYHCLIIDNSFGEANGIPLSRLRFRTQIREPAVIHAYQAVIAAYQNFVQTDSYGRANIRYAVLGLLLTLSQSCITEEAPAARSLSNQRVKQVISYIRTHLGESISLDDLAAQAGISKYHLSREFKALTGMTIIDTVNQIRCGEARRLIEGGMRVSAAAISCGFENLSYFSRTFKKHFQRLPSDFSGK